MQLEEGKLYRTENDLVLSVTRDPDAKPEDFYQFLGSINGREFHYSADGRLFRGDDTITWFDIVGEL